MSFSTPPPINFVIKRGLRYLQNTKKLFADYIGMVASQKLQLQELYQLGRITISKIPGYSTPSRLRPNRTGKKPILSDYELDGIIQYLSES